MITDGWTGMTKSRFSRRLAVDKFVKIVIIAEPPPLEETEMHDLVFCMLAAVAAYLTFIGFEKLAGNR